MAQAGILDASEKLETFSPRRIAQVIREVIIEGNRFSAGQAHLLNSTRANSGNYARTAVALEALALALLARSCYTIMPDLSHALSVALDLNDHDGRRFLPSKRKLPGPFELDLPPVTKDLAERLVPTAAMLQAA